MRKRTMVALGMGSLAAGVLLALRSEGNAEAQFDPAELRTASFAVNCAAPAKPISPLIYGIGGSDNPGQTGATAIRRGGNPSSRYNWELDTWNLSKDWFFKNVAGTSPGRGYELAIADMKSRGLKAAITVPMLGWVAKDGESYGFPVSAFGQQQAAAPDQPDAGNGVAINGRPLQPGPPTLTSVRSTPESIAGMVRRIRESDPSADRALHSYILDNEPMLWNVTHRDVHPEPTTYDELLEKTIAYGSAIRRADPAVKIAGPAEWGWLGYHYSARDTAAGVTFRPDRRAHGDEALLPWYLRNLRAHEQKTGIKVLDIVDVHFYPQGEGAGLGTTGATDPETAARRIRSTRSLWDRTYRDESWINERMQVIPLLRSWIAEHYPGLEISIGEWDFGAEGHMSGGLATAEALGRFGVEGLVSAYRWGSPAPDTPTSWAFRAFRNFDSRDGRFQDWSVPVTGDGTLVSLFASRDDARRRLVAVLLNLAPLSPVRADITLQGCGAVESARGFSYTEGQPAFTSFMVTAVDGGFRPRVAPYSINVIDVTLKPAGN